MGLPAGVDAVVFEDLKERYRAGSVVVFAGAGVSAAAGLPSWKRLAEILIERMRSAGAAEAIPEAQGYLRKEKFIEALSLAHSELGDEFYLAIEKELHDRRKKLRPPPIALTLGELGPKLAGAVTTNLDCLLERALGDEWTTCTEPTGALGDPTQKTLLKAHGTIESRSTWVFTRDQYDTVMFGRPELQDAFTGLFTMRTLLFVGASLVDDNVGARLGALRARSGGHPPMHFAILEGPVSDYRRRELSKAGIRLLAYENRSTKHWEAIEILRELGDLDQYQTVPAPPIDTAARARAGGAAATASPADSLPSGLPDTPSASAPLSPFGAAAPSPQAVIPPPTPVVVPAAPADIYISASSKDASWRDRLVQQFAALERAKTVRVAHEGLVRAGEDRARAMSAFLDRARIVLLLLTADYLASDEQDAECRRALQRADAGKAVVIPVYLKPCTFKPIFPGRNIKSVPEKAISTFGSPEEALLQVVEAVQALLPSEG